MGSLPIPSQMSEVDAPWLNRALGVSVLSVRPAGSTGGIPMSSTVARLRLELDDPHAEPTAVTVKVRSPRWEHGSEPHEREVRFYRDFAPRHALPVPRCYYADFDPASGDFVLVLEDLGDLVPGHRLDGLTEAEARAVLDSVADLHRAWWRRRELASLKVRGHDEARIERTMAAFEERWDALASAAQFPVDDGVAELKDAIRERYPAGMLRISQHPQTLIHSDLHVENFFLEATDTGFRLYIIDWQNPCFGHCAFDVAHVLTSLQPALSACHESLLEHYSERLRAPRYSLRQLRADVAAAIRHQLVGGLAWLAAFEADSSHEARIMQGHWQRLCAALVASERRVTEP